MVFEVIELFGEGKPLRTATCLKGVESTPALPLLLHVEDDDGDAYLVVRAVAASKRGVRIARAVTGQEAIKLLEEMERGSYEIPRLILLDMKLPAVSGLQILERIRSSLKLAGVQTVFFTSSDVDKDVQAAQEAGCNGYFVKPIDYRAFCATVDEICGKYLSGHKAKPSYASKAFAI